MISIPREVLTWLLSQGESALVEEQVVLDADEIGDLRPHLTDTQRTLLSRSFIERREALVSVRGWLAHSPTIHEIALCDRDEVSHD